MITGSIKNVLAVKGLLSTPHATLLFARLTIPKEISGLKTAKYFRMSIRKKIRMLNLDGLEIIQWRGTTHWYLRQKTIILVHFILHCSFIS
jgi:hypothetical protein